jgi:hypothetical protein
MSQSATWDALRLAQDARSPETHGGGSVAALMREVNEAAPAYVRCTYRRVRRSIALRIFRLSDSPWSTTRRRGTWAEYISMFAGLRWREPNQISDDSLRERAIANGVSVAALKSIYRSISWNGEPWFTVSTPDKLP